MSERRSETEGRETMSERRSETEGRETMSERRSELVSIVYDELWRANNSDPLGEDALQIQAEHIVDLVAKHRDVEIRAALENSELEEPLHLAMSTWASNDFLWRLENEGQLTHRAAMDHARDAIESYLVGVGVISEKSDKPAGAEDAT